MTNRTLFVVGTSLVAMLGTPAFAQDATPTPSTAPQQEAPDDTANSGGLGDIVVVATKRGTNLQDTPIAISAFASETLEKSRVETVSDLKLSTPGLSITTNGGLGQTVYLRGVGSSDGSPGQEAPVAVYIDNVYQPTTMSNDVPFANVERVEVLKGPQGTLFGRNATGGLIHIITKDPTEELSGNISASYGNYDQVVLKGYIASGLAEGLKADLAGYYLNRGKGWGRNIFTGNEIYKDRMLALRSKVVVEPSDELKVTLIGSYSKQKTSTNYNYRILPGSIPLTLPAGTPGFVSATPFGPTQGFYDVNNDVDGMATLKIWSVSGRAEYDLGFATLTSQTSYQKVKIFPNTQSPDATPNDIVTAAFKNAINNTFQTELTLASDSANAFRWIGGFYYLDMKGGSGGPGGIKLSGFGVLGAPNPTLDIVGLIDSKSYAAFAEIEYDLGPETTLTVGGRYTIDKRSFYGSTELDNSKFDYDPIPGTKTPFGPLKSTYKEPSYRAILNHKFTPDVMVYASYSHGFKSGNYNTVNPGNPPYDPEKLDAYEIGIKSRFLNDTLQFNAATFYYDYKGLQLQINEGPTIITINAAAAKVKGFELDMTAQPIPELRVTAGYSYLDAKYGNFPGAVCYFPNPNPPFGNIQGNCLTDFGVDIKGKRLIRTPEHQVNVTLDYTVPTSVGDFNLVTSYFLTSKIPYVSSGRLFEPSYGLLNGSLRWTDTGGKISVTAFAKNLLDKKYSTFKTEQAIADIQSVAPPRTYGVEVGFKF